MGQSFAHHYKRESRATPGAPGHQGVRYAESVRVEPVKALHIPVIHAESPGGGLPARRVAPSNCSPVKMSFSIIDELRLNR
jgi:hypothetical protein